MSKLLFKALVFALLLPMALHALIIDGQDGWKFEVSQGFVKKHISANIKDKTAKDKFIKRWGKDHQAGKRSTIVLKSDFVNAVKKMKPEAKNQLLWISLNGKTVYTQEKGGKAVYKCDDVNKIQIQQELVSETEKKMKLFHIEDSTSARTRDCKN